MADTIDTQALSRAEQYLQSVITGESDGLPKPRSREEQFLKNCCEGCGCDGLPTPRSRREKYLYALAEKIAQSGGGGEVCANTLNEYLKGTKTDITAEDLEGVTTLREHFLTRQPITSIEFPASVEKIDNYAFSGCTKLTSIVIPETITGFGARIFENCSGLVSVTLPKNMKTITQWMFISCVSLTSIVIPQSVSTISDRGFCSCSSLREVICLPETPPTLDSTGFYGVPADCIYKVKPASVEAYKSATNWSVRADNIVALTEEEMAQYGG